MGWFVAAGIAIGLIIGQLIQASIEAHRIREFDGEYYRQIGGFSHASLSCHHSGAVTHRIGGVQLIGCHWCGGVFVRLSDATGLQHE